MYGTYMGSAATRTEVSQTYNKGTIGNSTNTTEGITDLKNARFGVFAYYTGADAYDRATPTSLLPNFMYNQELIYGTATLDAWVYSPVKYWPNGIDADNQNDPSYTAVQKQAGKLSFFAFAPYTAATGAYDASDAAYPASIAQANLQKTANTDNGVSAITNNAWTGNVWVKYGMTNSIQSEAVDLLWGLAGSNYYDEADGVDPGFKVGEDYNINLTKQVVDEKVSFLFKHALAKIGGAVSETEDLTGTPDVSCGFKVQVDVDKNDGDNQATYFSSNFDNTKTLVTIKSVKIQDGTTASSDATNGLSGITSNLVKSGWFNIETGTWSSEDDTYTTGATYALEANNTDNDVTNTTYTLNEKFKEVGTYGQYGSGKDKVMLDGNTTWDGNNPTGVTTTAQDLFCDENVPGLMIIPISGVSSDLYVTVDYVVRTADKNLKDGYTQVEQVITNKVSLSSLLPNKYYTIIMHLGLTSVKFEAQVADWAKKATESYSETGEDASTGADNESKVWLPSNVVTANTWVITPTDDTYPAKGGDITLSTVTINGNNLDYAAAAAAGKYSLDIVPGSAWLTNDGGTLKASAYNTSTADRTAIVNVSTVVNGNTITKPITLKQAGFRIQLTAGTAENANKVTVTDGDNQNVTDDASYTVVVSGGDGVGNSTKTAQTITVTGTSGQTYNVAVTHTSGATATTTVTIP